MPVTVIPCSLHNIAVATEIIEIPKYFHPFFSIFFCIFGSHIMINHKEKKANCLCFLIWFHIQSQVGKSRKNKRIYWKLSCRFLNVAEFVEIIVPMICRQPHENENKHNNNNKNRRKKKCMKIKMKKNRNISEIGNKQKIEKNCAFGITVAFSENLTQT